MENKIRIMRKVLNFLMAIALISAIVIRGGYSSMIWFLIGGLIAAAIIRAFHKKEEPDEMTLQTEMFYSYSAATGVMAFLVIMHAVERGRPEVADAYLRVMAAWMIAWFGGVVFKRVWK